MLRSTLILLEPVIDASVFLYQPIFAPTNLCNNQSFGALLTASILLLTDSLEHSDNILETIRKSFELFLAHDSNYNHASFSPAITLNSGTSILFAGHSIC